MKLAFKYTTRWTDKQLEIMEELSYHLSKLYNIVNYDCRENGYRKYTVLEKEYKVNWHTPFLHSHTYQQALKVLDQNWKSYFASAKDYKKHPSKYKGEPRQPGFKNDKRKATIIFTNYAVRVRGNQLLLSLSKKMQEIFNVKSLNLPFPSGVAEHVDESSIQQVRLVWKQEQKDWEIIIIHKREEKRFEADNTNIMSIDIGLDNLCAIAFKDNSNQYLISGRTVKSKNSYFNKEIARLTSAQMLETGNKRFKRTNRISRLQAKRNRVMKDAMHKASRKVIELAIENKCKAIVLGDLKDIKQESAIKSFVQVPVMKLIDQIRYKAELEGIKVVQTKETYTSGVSAYDMEAVTKANYNKKRRVKRGLFKTEKGYEVNSDINGSLNILRKYMVEEELTNVVPIQVKELRDNGCMDHPVRLQVV